MTVYEISKTPITVVPIDIEDADLVPGADSDPGSWLLRPPLIDGALIRAGLFEAMRDEPTRHLRSGLQWEHRAERSCYPTSSQTMVRSILDPAGVDDVGDVSPLRPEGIIVFGGKPSERPDSGAGISPP
jgi:hypothetical protein